MRHLRLLNWMLLSILALAGCKDDDEALTDPQQQALTPPSLHIDAAGATSFTVKWDPVAHAAAYACTVTAAESQATLIEREIAGGEERLTVEQLTPETTYTVRLVAQPAEAEKHLYAPSPAAELSVTTLKEELPDAGLPEGQFTIDVEIASTEGIKLTYTPVDPEMLYIDMIFDESYLTEDGLTIDDIRERMIQIANRALAPESEEGLGWSVEQCLTNEVFYRGTHSGTHYGGHPAGARYCLSVVGLVHDRATNTVAAATQATISEPFTVTEAALPAEKPWVEMSDPTYADGRITIIITRNEAAGDYLFGGAFAEDYRQTHSDSDIIAEMAGTEEGMKKYLIPEWHNPIVLTGEVAPGGKKLFVATGEKDCIIRNMQLNWMILQAPYEAGGEVRILDSASGIRQPEYPEPEPPQPAEVTFEASARVEGSSVSCTVTPSDNDVYYFTYIRPAADVATPEQEQAAAENLIDAFNNWMYSTYYTVEEYIEKQGNLFKGTASIREEGFAPGEYCLIYVAAEITVTPGALFDTIEAAQIGRLGKTAFTIEAQQPASPFTASVKVEGGTATLTVTPSDPDVYYILDWDDASYLTPAEAPGQLEWKRSKVEWQLDNKYFPVGEEQIAQYMAEHNDLARGPATLTAEPDAAGAYGFYFFTVKIDYSAASTVTATSELHTELFTIE